MESESFRYLAIFRNGNRRPTTRRRRKKASPFKVKWGSGVCDGLWRIVFRRSHCGSSSLSLLSQPPCSSCYSSTLISSPTTKTRENSLSAVEHSGGFILQGQDKDVFRDKYLSIILVQGPFINFFSFSFFLGHPVQCPYILTPIISVSECRYWLPWGSGCLCLTSSGRSPSPGLTCEADGPPTPGSLPAIVLTREQEGRPGTRTSHSWTWSWRTLRIISSCLGPSRVSRVSRVSQKISVHLPTLTALQCE